MSSTLNGYGGRYTVTESGKVVSALSGVLRPIVDRRGRVSVALTDSAGVTTFHSLPHLVAAAFHPPPPQGATLSHVNGDTADNRAENLAWITKADRPQEVEKAQDTDGKIWAPAIAASQQRTPPVICTDTDGFQIVYPTLAEAAKATKVARGSIAACARGIYQTAGGYRWRYQTEQTEQKKPE